MFQELLIRTASGFAAAVNNMDVYIYGLIDPVTDTIRYVGKSNNPARRFGYHMRTANDGTHRGNWIENLKKRNLSPRMIILEVASDATWKTAESYWISVYKKNLTNLTTGGEGLHGITEVTRKRLSDSHKGKTISESTREKMRKASSGRRLSENARLKISLAKRDIPMSPKNKLIDSLSKQGVKVLKNSSSKFVGVTYSPHGKKPWKAHIRHGGKLTTIGHYKNEEEAAKAYDRKALELFGVSALTNFKGEPNA